jgi:hypothetical protein
VTAKCPRCGKANVLVDGLSKGTVDLYEANNTWQVVKTYGGLNQGSHTLVIAPWQLKNAKSTGTFVPVDAFAGQITATGPAVEVAPQPEQPSEEVWKP